MATSPFVGESLRWRVPVSASPCIRESLWWFGRPLDLHSSVSPGDGETRRWQVPATASPFVGESRRRRVSSSASPGGGDSLHQRVAFVGESLRRRVPAMIRIKSYVVITFSYRKANILRKWSKILHFCYGNKGLCHGCRSY